MTNKRSTQHRLTLVLLGLPGSGKGTQAKKLAELFGLPYLETGECLRREQQSGSDLGKKIGQYLNRGQLVPVELTGLVVRHFLRTQNISRGCVFDSFPRFSEQIADFERVIKEFDLPPPIVIYLKISLQTVWRRIGHRASYAARQDDDETATKSRIDWSLKKMMPVVGQYRQKNQLLVIDGEPPVEKVTHSILAGLRLKKFPRS